MGRMGVSDLKKHLVRFDRCDRLLLVEVLLVAVVVHRVEERPLM